MNKVYDYKIVEMDDVKYAVYENGEKSFVDKDENGKEFFYVPNFLTDDKLRMFNGRIKDVIDTIRADNGDALVVRNVFGKTESVVRYLDRKHGESLRNQTLEGFENANFGYSLKFGYLKSFCGTRFIKPNNNLMTFVDNQTDYIFFQTKEEAEAFKQECFDKAQLIVTDYRKVLASNNTDEIIKFISKNLKDDIISELWSAIADDDSFKFEVVQVLQNTK